MRKSGIAWATTPPGALLRSNTVTGTPALDRNIAAERPAGPAPTTATFLSVRFWAGCSVGNTFSRPRLAASNLVSRMCTVSS